MEGVEGERTEGERAGNVTRLPLGDRWLFSVDVVRTPEGTVAALGPVLPLYYQVGGRCVAMVDAGEHRALVALRRKLEPEPAAEPAKARRPAKRTRPGTVRLSLLDKDAEVRDFILARVQSQDVSKVREAAVARFGPARVPGNTAVCAFVRRHRQRRKARV